MREAFGRCTSSRVSSEVNTSLVLTRKYCRWAVTFSMTSLDCLSDAESIRLIERFLLNASSTASAARVKDFPLCLEASHIFLGLPSSTHLLW
jgi:hypothetical protein